MRFLRYAPMLVMILLAAAGNANAVGDLPIACVHDFGPFC